MSPDTRALHVARGWIGTPYVLLAALRGVGCDCVGLIRGVRGELLGQPPVHVPPWQRDWADAPNRILVSAALRWMDRVPPDAALPGHMVVLRTQGREAHCGILEEDDRIIHAVEGVGVARVPFAAFRPAVTFAAAFPHS
ncbi:MAG: NlpC/P60 family protein [Pseudomonadota bacterium]